MQVIRSGLGPLPFVKDKDEKNEGDEEAEEAPAHASAPASNRPAVLPDGSYATQVHGCLTTLMPGQIRQGQHMLCTVHLEGSLAVRRVQQCAFCSQERGGSVQPSRMEKVSCHIFTPKT